MSLERLMYGSHQIGSQARFDHVSRPSGSQCRAHVIRILMHGEKHKLRTAAALLELPCYLDPIFARHRDVEHDRVRVELRGCSEQVDAVRNRANYLEVAGKHTGSLH